MEQQNEGTSPSDDKPPVWHDEEGGGDPAEHDGHASMEQEHEMHHDDDDEHEPEEARDRERDANPYRSGRGGVNRFGESEQCRKLFIGGLSFKTDEESLKGFFSQYGEVVDCVVMRDAETKRPRGFGFITYATVEQVDLAQSHRPHSIDGKTVETKRAMPKEESDRPDSHVTTKRMWVGGVPESCTEDELRGHFSKFGDVQSVEIVMDKTGRPRGFAFVTFDDYDAVDKAILGRPHVFGGATRPLEVRKALSRAEMDNVRAGRGGGRDRERDSHPHHRGGSSGYSSYGDRYCGSYGSYGGGPYGGGPPPSVAYAYPSYASYGYYAPSGKGRGSSRYGGPPSSSAYPSYVPGGYPGYPPYAYGGGDYGGYEYGRGWSGGGASEQDSPRGGSGGGWPSAGGSPGFGSGYSQYDAGGPMRGASQYSQRSAGPYGGYAGGYGGGYGGGRR